MSRQCNQRIPWDVRRALIEAGLTASAHRIEREQRERLRGCQMAESGHG